ncbi:MAG: hypothetical protein M1825_006257 [Sarcosagium campestre]|nr:MAG: hypothetical protein M1825_006257 [Sarcosagium campestre]
MRLVLVIVVDERAENLKGRRKPRAGEIAVDAGFPKTVHSAELTTLAVMTETLMIFVRAEPSAASAAAHFSQEILQWQDQDGRKCRKGLLPVQGM